MTLSCQPKLLFEIDNSIYKPFQSGNKHSIEYNEVPGRVPCQYWIQQVPEQGFYLLYKYDSSIYKSQFFASKKDGLLHLKTFLYFLTKAKLNDSIMSVQSPEPNKVAEALRLPEGGISVRWDDISKPDVDVSKVPDFLSNIGRNLSFMRIRIPFTGDIVVLTHPAQLLINSVPLSVETKTAASCGWWFDASSDDKTAYQDWLSPKMEANMTEIRNALLQSAVWNGSIEGTIDTAIDILKNRDHVDMDDCTNSLAKRLVNTMSDMYVDIKPTDEDGEVSYHFMKILSMYCDDTKVLKCEADIRNAMMHACNGNIDNYSAEINELLEQFSRNEINAPKLTATINRNISKMEEDESNKYLKTLVDKIGTAKNIKLLELKSFAMRSMVNHIDEEDESDMPQYTWSEVPIGVHYTFINGYLAENSLPFLEIDMSTSNISDDVAVTCEFGTCSDVPKGMCYLQFVGWLWYNEQSPDVQASYDVYASAHDGRTYRQVYVAPDPKPAVYSDYSLRSRMQGNNDGFAEYMARTRNASMHATNGNIDGKTKSKQQQKPKPKVIKSSKPKKTQKSTTKPKPMVVHAYERKPKILQISDKIMKTPRPTVKVPKFHKADKDIATICANMILPGNLDDIRMKTVRFADEYSEQETAIATPKSRLNIQIPNTTDGTILSNPDFFAIMTRDPFCNLMYYEPNTAKSTYTYKMWSIVEATNPMPAQVTNPMTLNIEGARWLPVSYAAPTSAYAPHGPYWYPRRAKSGANYYYLGKGHVYSTIVTVGGIINGSTTYNIGAEIAINVYFDDNGTDVLVGTSQAVAVTTATKPTYNFICANPGYYAVQIFITNNTGATIVDSNITNGSFSTYTATVAHRTMPNLEAQLPRIIATRTNGAAMLATVTTSMFNINGQMQGIFLPTSRCFCEIFNQGNGNKLFTMEDTKVISQITQDNGMYGWIRPLSSDDFKLTSNFAVVDNTLLYGYSDLYPAGGQLIFYYSNTSVVPINMVLQAFNWVEYYTEDPWTDTALASSTKVDWERALENLKNVQTITANPVHVIMLIKAILGGLHKYAGPVGETIGKIAGAINDFI